MVKYNSLLIDAALGALTWSTLFTHPSIAHVNLLAAYIHLLAMAVSLVLTVVMLFKHKAHAQDLLKWLIEITKK